MQLMNNILTYLYKKLKNGKNGINKTNRNNSIRKEKKK